MFVVLVGCTESDNTNSTQQVQPNVFDAQMQVLEKAKGVEQQIEDAAAKQRQSIAEQGG